MTADPGDMAWVPDDGTFGARLALVRQKMKWNLTEAALACALKPNTWRDWELGEREPHRLELVCRQIARNTGCNHIWLMTGVDVPTPPVPPAGFEPAAFRSEGERQENVTYLAKLYGFSANVPTALPA